MPGVGGIELHLNPTINAVDAIQATRAATELPILAKLDLDQAIEIAADWLKAGANSLVIARTPRGIVASGGIHSGQDVKDMLSLGACAVEIDSAQWIEPQAVSRITGELGM